MTNYNVFILLSWAVFLLVWVVLAFNVKPDIRGGYSNLWRQYGLLRVVALVVLTFVALRVATGTAHYTNSGLIFTHSIFEPPLFLNWAAVVLTILGVGLAIWARVHIGRNWSPRPAVKEQHELVTTGPYAYVRHPIYAGVILMVFGTALMGSTVGIIALIISLLFFISRISREEKIMLDLFPQEYPAYQAKTKRLVPFVW